MSRSVFGHDGRSDSNGRNNKLTDDLRLAQSVLEPPFVQVEQIKFYSDRFYLNALKDDAEGNGAKVRAGTNGSREERTPCHCGACEAPPLFSREALLKSLELKAAIFASFTVNTGWLMEVAKESSIEDIPILILHGDKSLRSRQIKKSQESDTHSIDSRSYTSSPEDTNPRDTTVKTVANASLSSPDIGCKHPRSEGQVHKQLEISLPNFSFHDDNSISSKDEADTLCTQEEVQTSTRISIDGHTQPPSSIAGGHQRSPQTNTTGIPPLPEKERIAIHATAPDIQRPDEDFPSNWSFNFVHPSWRPSTSERVTREPTRGGKGSEYKRGVHHPKFWFLFETNGDLVVVVSTSNLTESRALEGSWVQRFRRRRVVPNRQPRKPGRESNDFGRTLQDFLEKLSISSALGETHIDSFMKENLQFSLTDFSRMFSFEQAKVYLVPVVPGEWKSKPTKTQPFVYGRHRLAQILKNMKFYAEHQDRLILQPTSLGGNWTVGELADVVRSYMTHRDRLDPKYGDNEEVLQRADIIWPSFSYLNRIHQSARKEAERNEAVANGIDKSRDSEMENRDSGYVFLSSQSFNSCHMSCIARLSKYRQSTPAQHYLAEPGRVLVPHFKSIARLLDRKRLTRKFSKIPLADEYLSWFLLTSACLSHGAQGRITSPNVESTKTHFANFELGVLFVSRKECRDERLYCFRPHGCTVSNPYTSRHPSIKLVHLPVPYDLRPLSFLGSDEDGVMCETPFFHEIDPGNRCVGNMLSTPYGIRAAKRQKAK